ncbi:MAG: hypothetical protein JXQ99_11095 [Hyphomicrobiaceae bacterium]
MSKMLERSGAAFVIAAMLLAGTLFASLPVSAGPKPKDKAPTDPFMVDAMSVQKSVQGLQGWAKQVSRYKAFKLLIDAGTLRGLYGQFEKKLRGREIAWVIARKEIHKNLSKNVYFIEHNGSRSTGRKDVETTVRCYVEDAIAERARAAPEGEMVLCLGKIVDIEFFRNFMSLGVEARSVAIGRERIASWVEAQPKAAK